jgi:hypothetical protein
MRIPEGLTTPTRELRATLSGRTPSPETTIFDRDREDHLNHGAAQMFESRMCGWS